MKCTAKVVLVLMAAFLVLNALQVQAGGRKCIEERRPCDNGGVNYSPGNCCKPDSESVKMICVNRNPRRATCRELNGQWKIQLGKYYKPNPVGRDAENASIMDDLREGVADMIEDLSNEW